VEAVGVYQQGLEALQRHDYSNAARLFNSVLDQYPEEKELHERVRLYLKICERQLGPADSTPRTIEERVYAATVAINKGAYDEALAQLARAERDDPGNDHAQYMLAVVHTLRGKVAEAIAHLQRAIALNSENRALARRDQDLAPLWEQDAFRSIFQTQIPTAPRRDRRVSARPRNSSS
jgi:tetratricopeptide (TPR) repeat protein